MWKLSLKRKCFQLCDTSHGGAWATPKLWTHLQNQWAKSSTERENSRASKFKLADFHFGGVSGHPRTSILHIGTKSTFQATLILVEHPFKIYIRGRTVVEPYRRQDRKLFSSETGNHAGSDVCYFCTSNEWLVTFEGRWSRKEARRSHRGTSRKKSHDMKVVWTGCDCLTL